MGRKNKTVFHELRVKYYTYEDMRVTYAFPKEYSTSNYLRKTRINTDNEDAWFNIENEKYLK